MMRKLKLSLIANERSRKTTFMKRKKGMMKKLHELTTLCGVQACGVIYSPYLSVPEAWPSKEGAEKVVSKFMEMSMTTQTKKMMNQETYLLERIAKVKEQVDKLALENRELQVRQFMFDCLEGKMSEYHYGAKDLHDLQLYIDRYIDQLTRKIQMLTENGESSSFPPLPVGVADAANAVVVSAASEFYDHIQYLNMNMNQNQQETIQHHVPINSYDVIPYQSMNMNPNQHEPVQYQDSTDLYNHIQHGIYNMNRNHDMNHNMNLNLDLNSNQYLNQHQSFMDMTAKQQMGYPGGNASIPFMDENHYNYHQLPIIDHAITSHMPSITTSTIGVYDPYINNNL